MRAWYAAKHEAERRINPEKVRNVFLGLNDGFAPRFLKRYGQLGEGLREAARADDGTIEALEDQGHDFFARSQDPFLVRVVQYNALYQIFKRYELIYVVGDERDEGVEAGEQPAVGWWHGDPFRCVDGACGRSLPPRLAG